MDKKIVNYLHNYLYYVAHYILGLIIFSVFFSIVSFFHLWLDHPLPTLYAWLFQYKWSMIIFPKLISAFIVIRFILVKNLKKFYLRDIFYFKKASWRTVVLIIFLTIVVQILFVPRWHHFTYQLFFKNCIAYFYFVAFYFSDLLIIDYLGEINSKNYYGPYVLFFNIFFILLLRPPTSAQLFMIFAYLSMMLIYWPGKNLTNALLFLLSFVAPHSLMMGFDPIWRGAYAICKISHAFDYLSCIVLLVIVSFYTNLVTWKDVFTKKY